MLRDLVQPCPKDLTSYLDVTYRCVSGMMSSKPLFCSRNSYFLPPVLACCKDPRSKRLKTESRLELLLLIISINAIIINICPLFLFYYQIINCFYRYDKFTVVYLLFTFLLTNCFIYFIFLPSVSYDLEG